MKQPVYIERKIRDQNMKKNIAIIILVITNISSCTWTVTRQIESVKVQSEASQKLIMAQEQAATIEKELIEANKQIEIALAQRDEAIEQKYLAEDLLKRRK